VKDTGDVISTIQLDAKCINIKKNELVSWGLEHDALAELFAGIDKVGQIYVSRSRRIDFSMLRRDVEENTGRELSEARFSHILALAAGGIKAHWVGNGSAAKLELLLVDEAGQERSMTTNDMQIRKRNFKEALKASVEAGEIPSHDIPPKPEIQNQISKLLRDPVQIAEAVPDLPTLSRADVKASAASKMQSTLDRIRAKQAAAKTPEALRYQELRLNLQICSDSLEAFPVVEALFARRECAADSEFVKPADSASEPEVLKALCSGQVMRPMDAIAARAAIAHLALHASDWFQVEEGTHVAGAKYYRRLPNSLSAVVLDRLKVERSNIEKELRSMAKNGPMMALKIAAPHVAEVLKDASTGKHSRSVKRSSLTQETCSKPDALDSKRRRISSKQAPAAAWLQCK